MDRIRAIVRHFLGKLFKWQPVKIINQGCQQRSSGRVVGFGHGLLHRGKVGVRFGEHVLTVAPLAPMLPGLK